MRIIGRISGALLLVVLALAAVAGFNVIRLASRQLAVAPAAPVPVDEAAAAKRLSTAVTIRTISFSPALAPAAEEFRRLHAHLADSFPKAHATLKREVVAGLSLLYTWEGSDPAAKPVLFMAHQDTVAVAPGTEADWTHPPFSGEIRDGYVWGRGSWDDKGNLMAMLEAIEMLVAAGYRPRHTVYLAFGHDEELSGRVGAAGIAALFKQRGLTFDFVLDEGMLITDGLMPGLDKPAALIGVAEKGFVTLELKAQAVPGHSSMPPQQTAIGTLARGLAALEANPMPASISAVPKEMFAAMAPEMSGTMRLLLANLWLTEPLLRRELEKKGSSNAMLRTTTALTVVQGGDKENVLPGRAQALVNFRLLPGDTRAGIIERTRRLVGSDITVEPLQGGSEPTPIAPTTSRGYKTIERTIREVFPGVVVAPGLMVAGTDSKHMLPFSENVYRFMPVRAKPEDLSRFHGTNERLSIANYVEMIRFYHRLIGNLDAGPAGVAQK